MPRAVSPSTSRAHPPVATSSPRVLVESGDRSGRTIPRDTLRIASSVRPRIIASTASTKAALRGLSAAASSTAIKESSLLGP